VNVQHLVKMLNQIEAFFRSEPDRAVAVDGIARHLQRFWDPRMRREIAAHVKAGGEGLGELAKAAVLQLTVEGKTT